MKLLFATLLTSLVLLSSPACTGLKNDFNKLTSIHDTIARAYKVNGISVNINNHKYLNIGITNTKYNKEPNSRKQEMAIEIGKMVLALNADSTFEAGVVTFTQSNDYLIANSTSSESFDMMLDSLRHLPE